MIQCGLNIPLLCNITHLTFHYMQVYMLIIACLLDLHLNIFEVLFKFISGNYAVKIIFNI